MKNKTISHPELGVEYSLPEKPTVFQILAYDSERVERDGQPIYVIAWEAAKILITDWKCEKIPDLNVNLSEITDRDIAKIIKEIGLEVIRFRTSLEEVPKN